jgi:hypothetical protein
LKLNKNNYMITEILKTLSDGELIAITNQLNNPHVDEQLVYKQLIAKGNNDESLEDMYDEMNSDSFRGTLPRLVASELANRFVDLYSDKI